MTDHVQWFDYPGEPTGAAGDLLDLTYQWIRPLTRSEAEAEALTLQVFHRTRQPLDAWLLRQPTLTRLKILVTTVVIAHRRAAHDAATRPVVNSPTPPGAALVLSRRHQPRRPTSKTT